MVKKIFEAPAPVGLPAAAAYALKTTGMADTLDFF